MPWVKRIEGDLGTIRRWFAAAGIEWYNYAKPGAAAWRFAGDLDGYNLTPEAAEALRRRGAFASPDSSIVAPYPGVAAYRSPPA